MRSGLFKSAKISILFVYVFADILRTIIFENLFLDDDLSRAQKRSTFRHLSIRSFKTDYWPFKIICGKHASKPKTIRRSLSLGTRMKILGWIEPVA